MPTSDLACHSCRKRKVKCDRTFPRCMVCDQTGLACNYPLGPMKPGPKIGSFQKQRKSRRVYATPQNKHARPHPRLIDDAGIDEQGGSLDTLGSQLEKEQLVPVVPTDLIETTVGIEAREGEQQNTSNSSHLRTLDLAFILHPSHEVTTPAPSQKQSPGSQDGGQSGLRHQACAELGLSLAAMNRLIRVFFDNMVAINLFHEPTFAEKLQNILSLSQLTALFAAMASYASRFDPLTTSRPASDAPQPAAASHRTPAYFIELAFKYINNALVELDDEMPSLCIIQALIIATHCRLTQGVRGKAWRSLGLCVSLIYEINLHLLDSGNQSNLHDPGQWKEDEEKRRAFWAVWEMDVFASTIRRVPTAIDWTRMEILLPVDNVHWFSDHPTTSCFLEIEPGQRWKTLQDSRSQSAKAWFIVINSLMKEAEIVCDPRSLSIAMGNRDSRQPRANHCGLSDSAVEARQKLETLANAVHCFSLALPGHLHYRDQYLAFGTPVQGQMESQRQQHSSIHNIFLMTQLARLMIYRYDAFRAQNRRPEGNDPHRSGNLVGRGNSSPLNVENGASHQYFEAADRILRIVSRSPEEHIQHINPFMPSTIWLASAVQLVRKHFAQAQSIRNLMKSRFDVLYLTYKRCVQFWDVQTALQRNLELIEEQLEARDKKPEPRSCPPIQSSSKRVLEDTAPITSSERDHHYVERQVKRARTPRKAPQYLPETPLVPPANAASIDDGLDIPIQNYAQHVGAADSAAMLDFMSLPQSDRSQNPEDYSIATAFDSFDSTHLSDLPQGHEFDLRSLEFPGIHDILAGWTTY